MNKIIADYPAIGIRPIIDARMNGIRESLEDKVIKLEFYIGKGRIYSFWFSESENGESGGFDGAGTDVVNN